MKRGNYCEADWATNIKCEMELRAQMLRTEIAYREQELKKAPEGELRLAKHRDKYDFYRRLDTNDRAGTYIRSDNKKLAIDLAQKDYNLKVVKESTNELQAIEAYLKKSGKDYIEIIESMHPERRALISPILADKETAAKKFTSVEYEPGVFADGFPKYYTAAKERVRSKSEIIIANTLREYGVPYLYECPLVIGGIEFRPDFTCLNLRTRRIYIWEHLGMMDDIGYARENVDKVSRYEQAGYMPGKNYILTMETSKSPISTRVVRANIEQYLT